MRRLCGYRVAAMPAAVATRRRSRTGGMPGMERVSSSAMRLVRSSGTVPNSATIEAPTAMPSRADGTRGSESKASRIESLMCSVGDHSRSSSSALIASSRAAVAWPGASERALSSAEKKRRGLEESMVVEGPANRRRCRDVRGSLTCGATGRHRADACSRPGGFPDGQGSPAKFCAGKAMPLGKAARAVYLRRPRGVDPRMRRLSTPRCGPRRRGARFAGDRFGVFTAAPAERCRGRRRR